MSEFTNDVILETVPSTLSYHSAETLPLVDAFRVSHMKYRENKGIFKSDRPRIWLKFVNTLLCGHTLAFGLDNPWL